VVDWCGKIDVEKLFKLLEGGNEETSWVLYI